MHIVKMSSHTKSAAAKSAAKSKSTTKSAATKSAAKSKSTAAAKKSTKSAASASAASCNPLPDIHEFVKQLTSDSNVKKRFSFKAYHTHQGTTTLRCKTRKDVKRFGEWLIPEVMLIYQQFPKAKRGIPTAIFDLDDTLICSSTNKCIPEIKELYDICVYHGMAVFFVTARSASADTIQWSLSQLKEMGIECPADRCIHRDPMIYKNTFDRIREYKADVREFLRKHGHTIIISAGDQTRSDIGIWCAIGIAIPPS